MNLVIVILALELADCLLPVRGQNVLVLAREALVNLSSERPKSVPILSCRLRMNLHLPKGQYKALMARSPG